MNHHHGKNLQQTQKIQQTSWEASSRERGLLVSKPTRGGEFCRPLEQEEPVSVWVGTPEDYPETNTYEYERRYL
jgi:hypothetical protein